MYELPYETTVCKIYTKLNDVTNKINRAALDTPLEEVRMNNGDIIKDAFFVTPLDDHDVVPNFTQFLMIKDKLVIDARQYMRYDYKNNTYKVTAVNDWTFQCIRLALTNKLFREGPSYLSLLTDVPAKVFTRWVSGALINRYNLPIEIQLNVYTVVCCYYLALIDPELVEPSPLRLRYVPIISKLTGVDPTRVYDIVDGLGVLGNANDLAVALSEDTGQMRTGDLKFADLFTLVSTSWFGVNARENIGVALEHVPTFIALIYMSVAERSYRKTVLTQRTETAGRPNELRAFVDLVENAISDQVLQS